MLPVLLSIYNVYPVVPWQDCNKRITHRLSGRFCKNCTFDIFCTCDGALLSSSALAALGPKHILSISFLPFWTFISHQRQYCERREAPHFDRL